MPDRRPVGRSAGNVEVAQTLKEPLVIDGKTVAASGTPVFRTSRPWMETLPTCQRPSTAPKSAVPPQPSMTGFSPGALVIRIRSLGQRLASWTGP
jgi:hypothetical protein